MAEVSNIPLCAMFGDTCEHVIQVRAYNSGVVVPASPDAAFIAANTSPVDISGWSAFVMEIHTDFYPAAGAIPIETINGVVIDAVNGLVEFVPAGTLPLIVGPPPDNIVQDVSVYFYDAQARNDNNRLCTFARGSYTLENHRTQAP